MRSRASGNSLVHTKIFIPFQKSVSSWLVRSVNNVVVPKCPVTAGYEYDVLI